MARIFTLAKLTTRCKERTENEGASYIDDPEWQGYINSAFAELYELLVESGLRYYEKVQTIDAALLVANGDGGAYAALPIDYLGTVGVDYQVATNERRQLAELMAQERNFFGGVSAQEARAYSLVGNNLVLYPTPPTTHTYQHIYVPQPTDYTDLATNTPVDVVVPAGEDYIVWGACIMAWAKEESDTAVAERGLARARERIMEAAQNRSILSMRRRVVQSEEGDEYDPLGSRYRAP